jgi:hypothetical protein
MQTTGRQDMSFGVLCTAALCRPANCLFQAGKELMDFDGHGSFLVASSSQQSG